MLDFYYFIYHFKLNLWWIKLENKVRFCGERFKKFYSDREVQMIDEIYCEYQNLQRRGSKYSQAI